MPKIVLHAPTGVHVGDNETKYIEANEERMDLPYGQEVEVSDSIMDVLVHSRLSFTVVGAPPDVGATQIMGPPPPIRLEEPVEEELEQEKEEPPHGRSKSR